MFLVLVNVNTVLNTVPQYEIVSIFNNSCQSASWLGRDSQLTKDFVLAKLLYDDDDDDDDDDNI